MVETAVLEQTKTWQADFIAWLDDQGKSERTLAAYMQDVRVFARWFEESNEISFKPEELTGWDLRGFRKWSLEIQKCSPATWNRRRATLKTFSAWVYEAEYLNHDPFEAVKSSLQAVEKAKRSPRWLGKQDYGRLMRSVEQLVNTARTDAGKRQALRDRAMIYLMVFGGLRVSEICKLTRDDVQIGERKGEIHLRQAKGGKFRDIPLNKLARNAIKAYLDIPPVVSGALFIGKRGAGVTPRAVQRRLDEIGRISGVKVTPHQLRHTFAKRMLGNGSPLTEVSVLLGHARIDTTARYVQPGWDDLERAVERL